MKRLSSIYNEMWVNNRVYFLHERLTKENLERVPIRLMMCGELKGLASIDALFPM